MINYLSKERFKLPILIPLVLVMSLLVLGGLTEIFRMEQGHLKSNAVSQSKRVEKLLEQTLKAEARLLGSHLEKISENKATQDAWTAKNRAELLQLTGSLYADLNKTYNITHFYFIDPSRVCFLRVHQPERHGDTINRFTMDQAASLSAPASGIELGPLGTFTLRVVRPWVVNGSLAGYLELGKEINHLLPHLRNVLNVDLLITINKAYLEKNMWDEGLSMLGKTADWDLFDNMVITGGTIDPSAVNLAGFLENQQNPVETSLSPEKIILGDDRTYLNAVIPLRDAGRRWVGSMFVLTEITAQTLELRWIFAKGLAVLTIVGILLVVLFYYIIDRVEKNLVASNRQLLIEVKERKKTERALHAAKEDAEAASRAKSSFLASMSHEIRTPMNAVLGFSDILLAMDLSSEQREYLQIIKTSGKQLLEVINDILDLSKIEAGKIELIEEPFSLRKMLDELMKTMAVQAHQKGLEIALYVAPQVPDALSGDAGRLRQVLINLVGNAVKFTEVGEVVLQADIDEKQTQGPDEHGHRVKFTVQDTGRGIAEDKQSAVFEAFTQADDFLNRRHEGTGLGLAICQRLAKMMQGEISLESIEGKGTVFSFTARFSQTSEPVYATPAVSCRELELMRVLIVDDNQSNRRILSAMLNDFCQQVEAVESGERALIRLANDHFDVVLLDVFMPGLDGFAVLQEIQNNSRLSRLAVIMLTSIGFRGDAAECRKYGGAAYLTKPVSQSRLLKAICAAGGVENEQGQPHRRFVTRHTLEEGHFPLNILVAEDNEFNRQLAAAVLENKGWQVTTVGNGRQAVEKFSQGNFDLVLMDIQMPELNGMEATKEIRKLEAKNGVRTPVVALTAHAMSGDQQQFLDAGMDECLTKPLDIEKLFIVIEKFTGPREIEGVL